MSAHAFEQRMESDLNAEEQQYFLALIRLNEIGTQRKADALTEAVQRGLRGPMRSGANP